jgi:hypothetical protein
MDASWQGQPALAFGIAILFGRIAAFVRTVAIAYEMQASFSSKNSIRPLILCGAFIRGGALTDSSRF